MLGNISDIDQNIEDILANLLFHESALIHQAATDALSYLIQRFPPKRRLIKNLLLKMAAYFQRTTNEATSSIEGLQLIRVNRYHAYNALWTLLPEVENE